LLYTFSENTELLWFSLYNILIGTLFVVLIFKKVIPSAWLWLLNFPKHMKSVFANLYYIRGNIRLKKGNLDWAIKDYAKTVYLKPKSTPARLALLRVLRKLERSAEANEQERLTRPLMQKETEYNQSCFEAICGNTEKALELLKIGLEKGQTSKNWARRDPDFENIRDDPRFKELIE
jgi:tetratricopeptide (TPR) repeat protein